MMEGKYTSFWEIDNRLRILKLQRKIDQENLKFLFNKSKTDFSPRTLLQVVGASFIQRGIWKQLLLVLALKKVVGVLRKGHYSEEGEGPELS